MLKKALLSSVITLSVCATAAATEQKEKHHEDPTRIITKIGVGYSDALSLSGSLGLDEARMLTAHINNDGEWRLGGSWLLDLGIINFNFSRTDYDHGSHRNNYSIGTYIPLSVFDISPANWMLFPMAGYSYNDGTMATPSDENDSEYIMLRSQTHGGYIGMFGVRPLANSHWSVIGFGGAGAGSNSYNSYWGGAGLSYKINDKASLNFFGLLSEDDYGTNNKLSGSISYQF